LDQIETYGRTLEIAEMHRPNHRSSVAALAAGYRSGLEIKNAKLLEAAGVEAEYEKHVIRYRKPAAILRYTPDFVLSNGVVVETKGLWVTADRGKLKLIREQHPEIDIRMVFSDPNRKISKVSKTTYADYCDALGIPYAKKLIPLEWAHEPLNPKSWEALWRSAEKKDL
jgi:hypothetical protein